MKSTELQLYRATMKKRPGVAARFAECEPCLATSNMEDALAMLQILYPEYIVIGIQGLGPVIVEVRE